MRLIEELDNGNLIIQLLPDMEDSFVTKIKNEFLLTFDPNKVKRIFLNFSSISQISSAGLSAFFNLKLFFKTFGAEVIPINLNEQVSVLFKALGLEQIIDKEKPAKTIVKKKKFQVDSEVTALKSELEFQKELYKRVTKELEAKLEKANADLKFKNQQLQIVNKSNSIGELAAGVAHEFNNIIGGIMGYAQLAQAKKTEEMVDKAFSNIILLSKRSEGITTGLLNYSRKRPVKVSPVNFKDVINGVLSFTQKQLENSNIKVHDDFKEIENFYADENLLSQVILNLVINASHAMENGGELFLSLYKENGNIIFKIKDTGIGIKKNNLSKIFLPFFTTKGPLGGGNKLGSGLGLSVSKSIVEMHEGKIEVESIEGMGATFTISLPEKIATVEYKEKINNKTYFNNQDDFKSKILIVDDEEIIRSVISAALFDQGHDIVEGINGEDGVKLYKSHSPELVFLDILMPRLNGIDAYLEIKRINPSAKIVFITGQSGENLEQVLVNLTKNDDVYLLRKPFEIKELINVVSVALSSKINKTNL